MVVFTVDFIFISWIFLPVVQIILFIQNKSSNFLLENVDEYVSSNHYLYQLIYIRSVDLSFSSTASGEASEWSVAWMYLATPTRAFLSASKEEEYNIFFFTLASSGHQDIKNSFSFFAFLGALALVGVLEVEQAVATVLLSIGPDNLQVLQKLLIGRITVSCCFNIDEFLVFDEEDNIAEVLLGLNFLKYLFAGISYCYSGSHFIQSVREN